MLGLQDPAVNFSIWTEENKQGTGYESASEESDMLSADPLGPAEIRAKLNLRDPLNLEPPGPP